MSRPPSRARGAARSLAESLDEDNREVLASLERRRPSSPMSRSKPSRTATPPPFRNMLDVGGSSSRRGSAAGLASGMSSPDTTRHRSVQLDPSDPSTYTTRHSSKPSSPVLAKATPVMSQDSSSAHDIPADLPQIKTTEDKSGPEQSPHGDPFTATSNKAGTSISHPPAPRHTREGSSSAMAAAMSGDFSYLNLGSNPPKHSTNSSQSHSRSPASRNRKAEGTKSPSLLSPSKLPGTSSQTGLSVSQRRLSNKSNSFSTVGDDSEEGQGRVLQDGVGDEDALAEYSEDDASVSSDDDEARGRTDRRKASDTPEPDGTIGISQSGVQPTPGTGVSEASQDVKSLSEPSISITSPNGDNLVQKKDKVEVQPPNNFVTPVSTVSGDEEDEDLAAIQKAKTLALNMSPLDSSVPDRHVRVVLRGDWIRFQQEAETGGRAGRLYLVCSDLSTEASYAMEWVVGTMLRDGDTLLAVYAIEDENAGKTTEADREILQAEGTQAGKDATDVMATLTRQTTQGGGTSVGLDLRNKYIPATEAQSLTGSVDARKTSKKQMERLRAVEEITGNFIKLVRKTTLQVRCMVEVIHCKSPKHLILGAIDTLDPTLCVVGTRGRSSLKGVLLGSFSNYLVTKSSVPVMVARRRLKKPRSQVKVSSSKIRLSNNLTASHLPTQRKSLTQARID